MARHLTPRVAGFRQPRLLCQTAVVSPASKAFLFVMFASVAFGQAQFIGGVWSGNVTPTSATVVVRLDQAAIRVRLQVSEKESLSPAIFSAIATTDASSGNTVKL